MNRMAPIVTTAKKHKGNIVFAPDVGEVGAGDGEWVLAGMGTGVKYGAGVSIGPHDRPSNGIHLVSTYMEEQFTVFVVTRLLPATLEDEKVPLLLRTGYVYSPPMKQTSDRSMSELVSPVIP
jgi:hypothetical protein